MGGLGYYEGATGMSDWNERVVVEATPTRQRARPLVFKRKQIGMIPLMIPDMPRHRREPNHIGLASS